MKQNELLKQSHTADSRSMNRPENRMSVPREWVEQLREGNHEAFNNIFYAFYTPVCNFLRLLTHSTEDAEELCQEVFIKLWQNRGKIDPSKSFHSYLYVIARNGAYDFFKKRKLIDSDSYRMWQTELAGCPDEIIIARETELLIDLAVSKMPRQRRRIFEMSRMEGLSTEEIAMKLNIRKNTVEKQLSYARKDIRNVLAIFLVLLISS